MSVADAPVRTRPVLADVRATDAAESAADDGEASLPARRRCARCGGVLVARPWRFSAARHVKCRVCGAGGAVVVERAGSVTLVGPAFEAARWNLRGRSGVTTDS